jgi:Holliday junction resolvase
MAKMQRDKGHNFEREVARQLREALPGAHVVRGQQGFGGSNAPDVAVDGANGSPWLHIECKRGKRCSIMAAIRQAVADSDGTGRVPIAVVREDRRVAVAVMRWDDYSTLETSLMVETGAELALPVMHNMDEHSRPPWRDWMYRGDDTGRAWSFETRDGHDFMAARWDVLVAELLAPLWRATQ